MNDKIEIHEILGKYYYYVDTKNADAWLQLWRQDGLLSNGPHKAEGLQQLTSFAQEHILDVNKHTRHMATNIFCEVKGNEANAVNYMLVVDSEIQEAQHATAICHSKLQKEGDTWLLVEHIFKTDISFDYAKLKKQQHA